MRLLALAAAVTLAGCATIEIPSKLYDMKNGKTLEASFMWKGDGVGPTSIKRETEICQGQYSTIREGKTTTGVGTSAGPWGSLYSSLYSGTVTEKAQKGVAIAICPSTMTFECEYTTNVHFTTVTGHGVCKDNRGDTYRLMF